MQQFALKLTLFSPLIHAKVTVRAHSLKQTQRGTQMKLILPALILALSTLASAQYATPTREIDVPAKTAFQYTAVCVSASNGSVCNGTNTAAIPAGMRAVVEELNLQIGTTSATLPTVNPILRITSLLNGEAVTRNFHAPFHGTIANTNHFYHLQAATKFYADSFSSVSILHAFPSGESSLTYVISGHYEKK
jgi:hypothetical protein